MRAGLEGYEVCEVLFLHEFGGVAGAVADDLDGVDAGSEAADVHAEVVGVGDFYTGYEFAFCVVDAYAGIFRRVGVVSLCKVTNFFAIKQILSLFFLLALVGLRGLRLALPLHQFVVLALVVDAEIVHDSPDEV